MSILDDIVAVKEREVAEAKTSVPLDCLMKRIQSKVGRPFREALTNGDALSVIAEVKKASPSSGLLQPDYDPVAIAQGYKQNGAAALSVLAEVHYFQGAPEHLQQVSENVPLPVLWKDFVIDEYQIYQAKAAGADCVLLIAALLPGRRLATFLTDVRRLGLEALIEVHAESELQQATDAGADLLGVNNRNLRTLAVDVRTSFRLAERLPQEVVAVSESGIETPETLVELSRLGYRAFLIGTYFLRQANPGRALADLLAKARTLRQKAAVC